jgi:hypothetical protein
MALEIPFSVKITNPLPVIATYMNGNIPFVSTIEANAATAGVRHIGMTVNINNVEYSYKNGILDQDLVIKNSDISRIKRFSIIATTNGAESFTLPEEYSQIIGVFINGWLNEDISKPNNTTVIVNSGKAIGQEIIILYLVDENLNIAPYYTQAQVDALIAGVDVETPALQNSYDINSEIITSPANGAFKLRVGSGANTDKVFIGENGAGVETSSIDGLGNFEGNSFNGFQGFSTLASDLLSKLPKGTYTGTASDLETSILAISTGVQGVAITPTSTPTGTGVASWLVAESGTYTNFGGVILPVNHIGFIIRSASNVYSITSTELDLTEYAKEEEFNQLKVDLFGLNSSIVSSNFNSSSPFSRTISNLILKKPIEHDNTIITGIRFKSGSFSVKISVVNWNEIEGAGSIVTELSSITKSVPIDTYFENLFLGYGLVANKGQYLMMSVSKAVNISNAQPTDIPFITVNSGLSYVNSEVGASNLEYFFTVEESYQDTILKTQNTTTLTNLLPVNFTETISYISKSPTLNLETITDGLRIHGTNDGDGNLKSIEFLQFPIKANRKYLLYANLYYNSNPITLNGNGFRFYSLNYSQNMNFSHNTRNPVSGASISQEWSVILDSFSTDQIVRFLFLVYPVNGAVSGSPLIDIVFKSVFLIDLGSSIDYFYNYNSTFFKSLLNGRKKLEVLNIENVAETSTTKNFLYTGKIIKSLGDSMPETRSYQYTLANALGAIYNGDPAGSGYLSSVIGGTWCSPVTTPAGGTQTIAASAYIRARSIYLQKPDILLIQTCTNDAGYFSSIYAGLNPSGGTFDHGLNDVAYTGNGVEVSNGVYQDANNVNKAPSIGASLRGMLTQLLTDMPNLEIRIIGIPRSAVNLIGNPAYNVQYYNDLILKNNVIKKVAGEFGIKFIDLANDYGPNNQNINVLTIDGIHYSYIGGNRVANLLMSTF